MVGAIATIRPGGRDELRVDDGQASHACREAVKFHNNAWLVYGARMRQPAARPLLTRLRRSQRFAVLMLLVFILRIGADVACTAHDIAGESASSSRVALNLDPLAGDYDHPGDNPFDISGSCDHCGCHQVAAILPPIPLSSEINAALVPPEQFASVLPNLRLTELRPPIV